MNSTRIINHLKSLNRDKEAAIKRLHKAGLTDKDGNLTGENYPNLTREILIATLKKQEKSMVSSLKQSRKIFLELQDFIQGLDIGYMDKSYFCGDLLQEQIEKIDRKLKRIKKNSVI